MVELLEGLRAEGLTAAWGVSNWGAPRLGALAAAAEAVGARVAATSPQVPRGLLVGFTSEGVRGNREFGDESQLVVTCLRFPALK